MTMRPVLLEYDLGDGVRAFSTTRSGGCGKGAYGEFNANMFCGDDKKNVEANREYLCAELGIGTESLIIPHQVHGTVCADIDDGFMRLGDDERAERLEGVDAMLTCEKGVCIGVSTADCIPILLYDRKNGVAGAVHAGWRGTARRIAEKAVGRMKDEFGSRAEDIRAVVGPGISLESFEVGDEVYDEFGREGFPMEEIARRYGEKWHIDLWKANTLQLEGEGVRSENIEVAGICTYKNYDRFFSARRLSINSGRILTGIMMN